MMEETCLGSYDFGVAEKNNIPNTTAIATINTIRSTMTINSKFNLPVETFCGEDSLTVFSNVVPEQERKKNINLNGFLRNEG